MEGKRNCPKWRTESQTVLKSAVHAGDFSRKHWAVLSHTTCVFLLGIIPCMWILP